MDSVEGPSLLLHFRLPSDPSWVRTVSPLFLGYETTPSPTGGGTVWEGSFGDRTNISRRKVPTRSHPSVVARLGEEVGRGAPDSVADLLVPQYPHLFVSGLSPDRTCVRFYLEVRSGVLSGRRRQDGLVVEHWCQIGSPVVRHSGGRRRSGPIGGTENGFRVRWGTPQTSCDPNWTPHRTTPRPRLRCLFRLH